MRLFGTRRSRASRPIWLAEEAGFDLPLVTVWQAYRLRDPDAPDAPLNTHSPAFRAISPQGAVPVLVDGDLVLPESLAITLHLARMRGGELGPRDEGENARMMQWSFFGATEVEKPALAVQQVVQAGREGTDEGRAELARSAETLARPFGTVAAHLRGRDWLVGDRFTVADLNLAEMVRYAQPHPPILEAHPVVAAWLARCQDRPAFRRMWEEREGEPATP